jgi:diadenosine tetraphosphate (Ap4A) HIT family hydrolase
MNSPLLMNLENRLSWQRFQAGATRRGEVLPLTAELDEYLVCSTEHFFVIVGSGAFRLGYLIIVTKQAYRSLMEIPATLRPELDWLRQTLSDMLVRRYQKAVVQFEHGMCGCSGADNAHLHLMPVSKRATAADFRRAIDRVLDHRGVGIRDEIDRELRREFRSEVSNREVWCLEKLSRLLLDNYLRGEAWEKPLGKYVYFQTPFEEVSFLTGAELGSQVGREIVFEVERHHSKALQKMARTGLAHEGSLTRRWQDFEFNHNMVQTMHDLVEPLNEMRQTVVARRFGFRSYLVDKPQEERVSPNVWMKALQSSSRSVSVANCIAFCCIAEKML